MITGSISTHICIQELDARVYFGSPLVSQPLSRCRIEAAAASSFEVLIRGQMDDILRARRLLRCVERGAYLLFAHLSTPWTATTAPRGDLSEVASLKHAGSALAG